MQKVSTHGVPVFEHPTISTARQPDWNDIRVFLAVARAPSFRAAAEGLGISFNTVRRHIEELERFSGVLLFTRGKRGVELTVQGQALLNAAKSMETAAIDVARLTRKAPPGEAGRVRISITEGLGTFWLVPRLVRFQRAHPRIILELNCTFRAPDLARLEADIAVQLAQPTDADLKVSRLGRMHIMPFAAPEYLRIFGRPRSLSEVANHKIVEQLSPQLDVTAVDRLFPGKPREGFVSLVTNTSTAHFWAVARAAGIGMLPTYLAMLGANIEPVDIGLRLQHDIWMSYHPDARRLRRVSLVLDHIRDCFDAKQFPCFDDRFVPPGELRALDPAAFSDSLLGTLAVGAGA